MLFFRGGRDPDIGKQENLTGKPRAVPADRPAGERQKDFELVSQGLTCDQASCEAGRCLQCDLRGDITRVRFWTEYSVK